ncbi:helix-turn-helix domain-containing protein [Microbacterium sp.]|uniref:helix-turn-helix domain-containing protein n=1 Tax=Microbacterium sp. TaxID=51671 RepID=UPI0028AF6B8F|nr:helix-turn-helix domain-containing protein [Microbacterium sp.]
MSVLAADNVTVLRPDESDANPTQAPVGIASDFGDVPPIMSPKTLAGVLEVTPLTLQRWRDRNEGPVWIAIPGSNVIRYTRADLLAWLAQHRAAEVEAHS